MSKFLWIFLACMLLLVMWTPPAAVPAQVQTSNVVMVVVKDPSLALLNDLRVTGVSIVSSVSRELARERFELGQVVRRTTRGYEPYTLLIDGRCRMVRDWFPKLMACLASAHTNGFSAVTQMPAPKGPTFPFMEQSGYRARVFVFAGRPYQSEVVSRRFLFGTSPIIKPFLKRKNLTLFASDHHMRVCNAIEWVVSGPDEVEPFGVAREVLGIERTDKYGNGK